MCVSLPAVQNPQPRGRQAEAGMGREGTHGGAGTTQPSPSAVPRVQGAGGRWQSPLNPCSQGKGPLRAQRAVGPGVGLSVPGRCPAQAMPTYLPLLPGMGPRCRHHQEAKRSREAEHRNSPHLVQVCRGYRHTTHTHRARRLHLPRSDSIAQLCGLLRFPASLPSYWTTPIRAEYSFWGCVVLGFFSARNLPCFAPGRPSKDFLLPVLRRILPAFYQIFLFPR